MNKLAHLIGLKYLETYQVISLEASFTSSVKCYIYKHFAFHVLNSRHLLLRLIDLTYESNEITITRRKS